MVGSQPPMTDNSDDPEGIEPDHMDGEDSGGGASVIDDVKSLIDDSMTYAEAELTYQKTRLAYVGAQAKWIAIFVGIAALLIALAIIALVLGSILALAELFTPVGATVLVVASLAIMAFLFVILAKAKFRELMRAFAPDEK